MGGCFPATQPIAADGCDPVWDALPCVFPRERSPASTVPVSPTVLVTRHSSRSRVPVRVHAPPSGSVRQSRESCGAPRPAAAAGIAASERHGAQHHANLAPVPAPRTSPAFWKGLWWMLSAWDPPALSPFPKAAGPWLSLSLPRNRPWLPSSLQNSPTKPEWWPDASPSPPGPPPAPLGRGWSKSGPMT